MTNIVPIFAIGMIIGSISFFLGGYLKAREYNTIKEMASDILRKSADNARIIYDQNDKLFQLKKTKEHLITENKGLKNKNKNQKNRLKQYKENNRKLKQENKQLKQEFGELGRIHAEEINKIEDEFDDEILVLQKCIQEKNRIIEKQRKQIELCQ